MFFQWETYVEISIFKWHFPSLFGQTQEMNNSTGSYIFTENCAEAQAGFSVPNFSVQNLKDQMTTPHKTPIFCDVGKYPGNIDKNQK